jgi:hypothetical protein
MPATGKSWRYVRRSDMALMEDVTLTDSIEIKTTPEKIFDFLSILKRCGKNELPVKPITSTLKMIGPRTNLKNIYLK